MRVRSAPGLGATASRSFEGDFGLCCVDTTGLDGVLGFCSAMLQRLFGWGGSLQSAVASAPDSCTPGARARRPDREKDGAQKYATVHRARWLNVVFLVVPCLPPVAALPPLEGAQSMLEYATCSSSDPLQRWCACLHSLCPLYVVYHPPVTEAADFRWRCE